MARVVRIRSHPYPEFIVGPNGNRIQLPQKMFEFRSDILSKSSSEIITILRMRPRYPTIDYPEITRQRPHGPYFKANYSHAQFDRMAKAEKHFEKRLIVTKLPISSLSPGMQTYLTRKDVAKYLRGSKLVFVRTRTKPVTPVQHSYTSEYIRKHLLSRKSRRDYDDEEEEEERIHVAGKKCPISPREKSGSASPAKSDAATPDDGFVSPTSSQSQSSLYPTDIQPISKITVKPKKKVSIQENCLNPRDARSRQDCTPSPAQQAERIASRDQLRPDSGYVSPKPGFISPLQKIPQASSSQSEESNDKVMKKKKLPYERGSTVRPSHMYRCAACAAKVGALYVAAPSTPTSVENLGNGKKGIKYRDIADDPSVLKVEKMKLLPQSKKFHQPYRHMQVCDPKDVDSYPGVTVAQDATYRFTTRIHTSQDVWHDTSRLIENQGGSKYFKPDEKKKQQQMKKSHLGDRFGGMMEKQPNHLPKLRRSSVLISLTPGSVLSKRIAYSRDYVRVPVVKKLSNDQETQELPNPKNDRPQVDPNSCHLPRIVNPDSSLAKRYAYSMQKKGKSDPLSEEMRSYFQNTSMIDTWLRNRVMREIKEEQDSVQLEVLDDSQNSPQENSYYSEPCSALAKRQAYSSKPAGQRDALQPETREYFLYQSQLQTWGEERIVRAIYSWINRKYGGPSPLTVFLRPTRRFITSILRLMPPLDRSLERLLRLVEEQWIKPRYIHYYQTYVMVKPDRLNTDQPQTAVKAIL